MPRITNDDAKYYQQDTQFDWLTLKNDMDVARVQFLFNDVSEIPTYACHKVKVGDKDRYCDCLRQPGDPIDTCPLCAAGFPPQVLRIVCMYDHTDFKVKIWERGPTFISKLEGLMNRYSPFNQKVFDIERHGIAGSQTTKYEIYPLDNADVYDVADVEIPELLGSLIIEATWEDQDYYLQTGNFPPQNQEQVQPAQAAPQRRVPAQAPAQRPAPAQAPRAAQQAAPAQRPAPSQAPRAAQPAAPAQRPAPAQAPRAAQQAAPAQAGVSRRTSAVVNPEEKF